MPAPKDPRVQLEEMRLQGKSMQLAHDKQMFALDLMEQRRVNTAKIRQLTAQAMKLASEVGTAGAGLRLKAIDTAVAALQAHNDMIAQKLEATEEGSEDDTERGGVSGVAEPVDDSGILEAVKKWREDLKEQWAQRYYQNDDYDRALEDNAAALGQVTLLEKLQTLDYETFLGGLGDEHQ